MNRNFSLLLSGYSLANIGDVLYMVSVISVIFSLTGSATAASFVPFTITSAMFLSSLLTPLLIGKVNLKWLMAGSQIGKTVLLVVLGFMLKSITGSRFILIFIIIGWIAFLDGCANPIRQALIPHYVRPEHLVRANGIAETVTQILQAVMWFVGSLFLLILSPHYLIWLVAVLFIFASILFCLLENVSHQTTEEIGKLEQIKEGWKALSHTPVLQRIAWMDSLESMAATVWIAAILLVFVSEALQVGEKWWGLINGTYFMGLILGSLYCIKYASHLERKLGAFIFRGSLVSCLVTFLFGLNSIPIFTLFLSFLVGLSGQIKNLAQQTIVQTSVPKEKLANVYTSLGAIGTGIFGIGSLIMGIFADWLGIRMVFMLSGLLLAIVSVISYKSRLLLVRNIMGQ